MRKHDTHARHASKTCMHNSAWTMLKLLSSPGALQQPTVDSTNGSPSLEESRRGSEVSSRRGSHRPQLMGRRSRLAVEPARETTGGNVACGEEVCAISCGKEVRALSRGEEVLREPTSSRFGPDRRPRHPVDPRAAGTPHREPKPRTRSAPRRRWKGEPANVLRRRISGAGQLNQQMQQLVVLAAGRPEPTRPPMCLYKHTQH